MRLKRRTIAAGWHRWQWLAGLAGVLRQAQAADRLRQRALDNCMPATKDRANTRGIDRRDG
jgi:hypothetical protein